MVAKSDRLSPAPDNHVLQTAPGQPSLVFFDPSKELPAEYQEWYVLDFVRDNKFFAVAVPSASHRELVIQIVYIRRLTGFIHDGTLYTAQEHNRRVYINANMQAVDRILYGADDDG